MRYYLAIDQGTHASRACLFDETGRLVSEHSKSIQLRRISNTHVEQDANEIVNSVKHVVAKALHEVTAEKSIIACGIAIQRSSVLAWHKDGSAISPVLSWQDTRGSKQLEDLNEFEDEIKQISGLPLSAHYGASKLNYLLQQTLTDTRDQTFKADTLRLSPLISYLLFHLLEEHPYIVDHTNAQRTQLFSIEDLAWSSRLAELFDVPLQTLPDCIPVLNSTSVAHGKLAGTEIPVTAISGDQNAAIFGSGVFTGETVLVNFGSGAFVLSLLPHIRTSKNQLSSIACSAGDNVQYAREATINGAGSALTWLEKRHAVHDLWKQLPAWLNEIGVDGKQQPPLFFNAVGGLGSPWWNSSIEPEFIYPVNSTTDTEAKLAAQAVAVIESVVFMVCINLEIMRSEQTLNRLRVCGGLSQLDGLCQRLADLSTLPVERLNLSEATSRGIAWLAAGRPGDWSNVEVETFGPASNTGLNERYSIFSIAMNKIEPGDQTF